MHGLIKIGHTKPLSFILVVSCFVVSCGDTQTDKLNDEVTGTVDVSSGHATVTLTNNTSKDIYFHVLEGKYVGASWTTTCASANRIVPNDSVTLETDSPATQEDDLEFVQVSWWHKLVANNTEVCNGMDVNTVDVPIQYTYAPSASEDTTQSLEINDSQTENIYPEAEVPLESLED